MSIQVNILYILLRINQNLQYSIVPPRCRRGFAAFLAVEDKFGASAMIDALGRYLTDVIFGRHRYPNGYAMPNGLGSPITPVRQPKCCDTARGCRGLAERSVPLLLPCFASQLLQVGPAARRTCRESRRHCEEPSSWRVRSSSQSRQTWPS